MTVDKERAFLAGVMPGTVYRRLSEGWSDDRAYAPPIFRRAKSGECPCTCGNKGTVLIATLYYCAATAAILRGSTP